MSDGKKFIAKDDLINILSSYLRNIGKQAEAGDTEAIKRDARLALRICDDARSTHTKQKGSRRK
jgi:hypothetical protein